LNIYLNTAHPANKHTQTDKQTYRPCYMRTLNILNVWTLKLFRLN